VGLVALPLIGFGAPPAFAHRLPPKEPDGKAHGAIDDPLPGATLTGS
jgi:hypothetical protein